MLFRPKLRPRPKTHLRLKTHRAETNSKVIRHSNKTSLDDLFVPDTPQAIQQLYKSFIVEAQERDFGPLTADIIVLDTETTGLSFRSSELIEVAAVRMSGSSITKSFHSYVAPHQPIPKEIQKLTGISNDDVKDAPQAKQVITKLSRFVKGLPVLAHNAEFDRHFIETVRDAPSVSEYWIDTLTLSRIALPCLASHRLADLASAFRCADVSHQASDDVAALCGVWRVILCGLSHLPTDLLALCAKLHPEVDWAYRSIFSYLAQSQSVDHLDLQHIRKELLRENARPARTDAFEVAHPLKTLTPAEIREEFDEGSTVSQMYRAYERRSEQISMAEQVLDALATSTHLVVEAGTGVGKSVAYLLPLVYTAQMNNITVGVATKTNALADQLITHDLPALNKVIPGGVTFFSLKGFEHYPCLHRVLSACEKDLPLDQVGESSRPDWVIEQDMLNAIATILAMACQLPSGDLDGLGIRWKAVPRSMVSCSSEECLRMRCPFFTEGCLVHGARRRAASADVVVTNHSLLLRNVEAEGNILPPVRHWVIDEAHSFETEARKQWAQEISSATCRAVFEKLGSVRSGAISTLMAQAATKEGSTLAIGLLTKAVSSLSAASAACADLFAEIHELSQTNATSNTYDNFTIWISDELRTTATWQQVEQAGKVALEKLDASCKCLAEAHIALTDIIQDPDANIADATQELIHMRDAMKLILEGSNKSYVFSAALSRGAHAAQIASLCAEKLDIGYELSEKWLPDVMSAIFTSATLAVDSDFAHFKHSVGLDNFSKEQHKSVQLDSSYNFDEQMDVVICQDLPDPRTPNYLQELEGLLYDVHIAMDGSVLTLFTNRKEMEQMYEQLAPRLSQRGLELSMQERRSSTRSLRNRFVQEKTHSLFALRSYWEGFDAGGDTLRCVVIPKLPFSSPQEPLARERDLREERAWWRYSLPEAVLAVKQAAGRLIRTAQDTGVLVLCDSRLTTKTYGRVFVSSLQSAQQSFLNSDEVADHISVWRAKHNN